MTTTTTEELLSSSDARAAILSRHDELRGLVMETIHFADEARESQPDSEPLRAHARELYQAFEQHVIFEKRILAAALRDVIGWGAVLQAQMEEGHERQRATLASALLALEPDGLSPISLVEGLRSAADTLLHDLSSEERCLLHADLGAIATDGSGG